MQETRCKFSLPVEWDGSPANGGYNDEWAFSKMTCTSTDAVAGTSTPTDQVVLIQNPATSTSFYLDKSISYGDFLVVVFLMLFLVGGLVSFLISWFIPKRLNWKMH